MDKKEIKKIVEKYGEELLQKKNVNGFSEDPKKRIKDGKEVDEEVFRIYVEEKEPLVALSASDVVPKEIEGIKTDIVEIGKVTAPPKGEVKKKGLVDKIIGCLKFDRKGKHRPFPMSVSLGNLLVTAGTAGAVFVKTGGEVKKDSKNEVTVSETPPAGTKVVFTNSHVGMADLRKDLSEQELRCCQQGVYDGGGVNDVFGKTCMGIKLPDGLPAFNDACIINPDNDDDIDSNLLGIGYPAGITTVKVGDEVKKSGRTTAVTSGKVTDLNATVNVSYGEFTRIHKACILTTDMSDGGDSGSIMVKIIDGKPYIWGYLFAGSSTVTVCHEIQNIMSVFGIELYKKPTEDLTYTIHIELEREGGNSGNKWIVKGDVVDKKTKNPLDGVKIILNDNSVYTDVKGKFEFTEVPEGDYTLTASKENYKTHEEKFSLPPK